ncbi:MAG: insulinase family protein [Candidatus Brocadiia bacterium]
MRIPCLRSNLAGVIAVLGLVVGSAWAAEGPALEEPLPADPAINMEELPNGLDVWIRHHEVPPGRVGLWLHVDTGSLNETDSQRGLAHFLEHVAFRGSENFPPGELIKFFESIGLTFGHHQNAFTGFDQTTYTLTLPDTEEETLRKGLTCLADFAFRLSLLQEEIDKERSVVLEEVRAREGPYQRVLEKVLPILLPGSRVAERLPIGKEEVIERLDSEDFRQYYETWYRPGDSTLLVVGDVEPERMRKLVADAFGEWEPVEDTQPDADPGIEPYEETRAAVLTDPEVTVATVEALSIRPLEPLQTVGDFRRDLVDDLGIWILNRRLSDMVQEGEAPFQEAELAKFPLLNVATYITCEADCAPDRWEETLETLLVELKRAREHGFLPQEFENAKRARVSAAERAAQAEPTRDQRFFLRYMNECVSEDRPPTSAAQRLELTKELMEGISLQEVLEAFRRNYSADARLLLLTMPETDDFGKPEKEALLSAGKRAEQVEVEPQAARRPIENLLETEPNYARVAEREEDTDLGVVSVTLENGVRAHVRHMDYKKDEVLVRITLAGGAMQETPENRGVTEVAALVLKQPASERFSSTQIRDYMTGKKAELGGTATPDSLLVSLSGTPEDIEEGFRLVHLLLTRPRIEPSALRVWKDQMVQEVQRRRTDVQAQLEEEAKRLLSGGDVRLQFPSRQQVDSLTLQQGQAWLDRLVKSGPIEAAVVGDIDRDRALRLVRKYLGSLPERAPVAGALSELREVDVNAGPLESTIEVDTITPRALVMVGWRGANWTDMKDRRVLQIASQILQTRLREEIREERGLTYSPFCFAQAATAYRGTGRFVSMFTAGPAEAAEAARLTRNLMQQFAADGPSAEEMATVRRQFANVIETQQQEPSYWARVMADMDYHGTRLEDVKQAMDKYTTYTTDDMLDVLDRYVTEARRIRVIALPQETPETAEETP